MNKDNHNKSNETRVFVGAIPCGCPKDRNRVDCTFYPANQFATIEGNHKGLPLQKIISLNYYFVLTDNLIIFSNKNITKHQEALS